MNQIFSTDSIHFIQDIQTSVLFGQKKAKINKGYQVVIRSDSKHLSKVAEGDGSVRLEPEVTVVVPRGQVTALPEELRSGWIEPHEHQYICILYSDLSCPKHLSNCRDVGTRLDVVVVTP